MPLRMKTAIKHITFFTILFLLVLPKRVDAYLDPDTGSYLLQIMVATLFGGLFLIKTWWTQIKNFISRIFFRKDAKESEKKPTKEK